MPEQLGAALQHYAALGYDPKQLRRLAALSTRLTNLRLGVDDLETFVAHSGRLTELGLDGAAAEALATTLALTGAPDPQRGDILAKAVELGQAGVTLAAVQEERDAVRAHVQQLRDERAAVQDAIAAGQDELAGMQVEVDQARAGVESLRDQAFLLEDAIAAGRALQHFLLSHLDLADAFLTRVVTIHALRRKGALQVPGLETWLTGEIQARVREFLKQITAMPPAAGSQGSAPKG